MPGSKRWKTCGKGLHDLTDEANVTAKTDGTRQCGPCHAEAKRAYAEAKRGGPAPPRGIQRDDCEVDGCGRVRRNSGSNGRSRYCATHYDRVKNNGEVYADVPIERTTTTLKARRAALGG